MDFIAVDFETPNRKNDSICSMGITLVKNTQVVWSRSTLVNPRAVFDDRNIGVHGITRQMVKESPTFAQIWQEYGRYFRHYSVVMHNAGFDASVLKKAAKRDGVSLPPMDIYCTMRLCEENYGFEHLSLSSICDHFGFCLNHHNAESDAFNTAMIMLHLLNDETTCIHAFCTTEAQDAQIPSHSPNFTATSLSMAYPNASGEMVQPDCNYTSGPLLPAQFKSMCAVFTGDIPGISRSQARAFVESMGGRVASNVSRRTTHLIIGQEDLGLVGTDGKSGKIEKAESLIQEGCKIALVHASVFKDFYQTESNARFKDVDLGALSH